MEKKPIIINQDSEADTCRKEVTPKLYEATWSDEQILEQRTFTDGKIVVFGRKARRKKGKRADYILRYQTDYPIAVIEAKKKYTKAADGLQQAKEYAQILGLNFAYATNGAEIIEFDFTTGLENKIINFPTPVELWNRETKKEHINEAIKETLLKPFHSLAGKKARYYQTIAINRAIKNILDGKRRLLLTMATGTGKTTVSFQIIYKLWNNRWNQRNDHRRPKILFLADRSILVNDPHSKDFAIFGDARCLVPDEGIVTSREIYFSTYQSLAEYETREGNFRKFPRDFFDLIVIDECHRGSASDESNWRKILDYFTESVHLGLTATPQRDDNKDTYLYFGNPIYTYSLKQGIEDGFLAPYIVHRIVTEADATGWRPESGQVDAKGNIIADGVYTTSDFERTLSLLPRTKAVAKHLADYMAKNGRYGKTIVFCVDQEHAGDMRRELNNLNTDITKENPNYVVRVVSEEGDVGKGHLSDFMDIDEEFPVIVTTSKLLSTGVDIPTCANVVLFRNVNSMTEFKQIIGRGTRVREDKGKLFFTILDYTGSASRNFADPEFDGEPPLITNEVINDDGETIEGTFEEVVNETEEIDSWEEIDDTDFDDITTDIENDRPRKYYVEEGTLSIVAETVQILDSQGKLHTIQYSQYTKDKITTLFPSAEEFKNAWLDLEIRKNIIEQLEEQGILIEDLKKITKLEDVDAFDLLCHVAFDLKPLTRKQRADLLLKNKPDLFTEFSVGAMEIIEIIISKYVDFGLDQLKPEIIQVEPISSKGNIVEIAEQFGGIDKFKTLIEELQKYLYAA
jgi:type I restriction enzyme R subunit